MGSSPGGLLATASPQGLQLCPGSGPGHSWPRPKSWSLSGESISQRRPISRGWEEQLTNLSPSPAPPSPGLLLVPSGEERPQQVSLCELNNRQKNFSGPVGPGRQRGSSNAGMLHFQNGGLCGSLEARAQAMGQDRAFRSWHWLRGSDLFFLVFLVYYL